MTTSPNKRSAAGKAAHRLAIAQRRRQVLLLLRAGHTQEEVAQLLGVSEATVSSDVATVRAALNAESKQDAAAIRDEELAALAGDEAAMREKWEATGDVKYYDRIAAIMERRIKLLALDLRPGLVGGTVAELDSVLARLGLGG